MIHALQTNHSLRLNKYLALFHVLQRASQVVLSPQKQNRKVGRDVRWESAGYRQKSINKVFALSRPGTLFSKRTAYSCYLTYLALRQTVFSRCGSMITARACLPRRIVSGNSHTPATSQYESVNWQRAKRRSPWRHLLGQ